MRACVQVEDILQVNEVTVLNTQNFHVFCLMLEVSFESLIGQAWTNINHHKIQLSVLGRDIRYSLNH